MPFVLAIAEPPLSSEWNSRWKFTWMPLKGKSLIREERCHGIQSSSHMKPTVIKPWLKLKELNFCNKNMPYVNTLNGGGLIRERDMSWNWKRCQYEYIKGQAFHNCMLTFSMNWNDYGGLIDFRPCNMNMSKDEDFMMQILVGINNKDV